MPNSSSQTNKKNESQIEANQQSAKNSSIGCLQSKENREPSSKDSSFGCLQPKVYKEPTAKTIIGILGLQGDYFKHQEMLDLIDGVETRIVKMPDQLKDCAGLVIPGGESTTVGKLMERYGIDEAIKQRVSEGMAVFGTCMGMILLSKEIEKSDQQRLGLIDMEVRRNAFGRQVDSYETDLTIQGIEGEPLRAVFIRAPYATRVWGNAKVLASLDTGEIIMIRQGKILAAAFHPELTGDTRVHELFVEMARS